MKLTRFYSLRIFLNNIKFKYIYIFIFQYRNIFKKLI